MNADAGATGHPALIAATMGNPGRYAKRMDEWFVPDLAQEIGVCPDVVYAWIRKGELRARQMDGPQGRWIVHADAATLDSLKAAANAIGAQGSKRG